MASTPQTLGPYTILRTLAVGGQARVLLGRLKGPGGFALHHALKVLEVPGARDGTKLVDIPEARALIAEARLLAQLNNPHTLAIHGLHHIDEHLVMVLEYVAGQSLSSVLAHLAEAGQTMPLPHALWIARCVLMALEDAHTLSDQRGTPLKVVHRDVSPENILLGYDGRVKLIDFGIAISRIASRNTRVGMVKGKLYYMAPEQATANQPVDHRCDVYATGLCLYEMATTARALAPPQGVHEDTHQALERARNPAIVPARTHNDRLPAELDTLLARALTRTPDNRYRRARDMMVATVELLHGVAPRYCGDELGPWLRKVLQTDFQAEHREQRAGGTEVFTVATGGEEDESSTQPLTSPLTDARPRSSRGKMLYVATRQPTPARKGPPPVPPEALDATRVSPPPRHSEVERADDRTWIAAQPPGLPPPPPALDPLEDTVDDEEVDLGELLQAIEDIYDRRSGRDGDRPAQDESTRIFRRK